MTNTKDTTLKRSEQIYHLSSRFEPTPKNPKEVVNWCIRAGYWSDGSASYNHLVVKIRDAVRYALYLASMDNSAKACEEVEKKLMANINSDIGLLGKGWLQMGDSFVLANIASDWADEDPNISTQEKFWSSENLADYFVRWYEGDPWDDDDPSSLASFASEKVIKLVLHIVEFYIGK